MNVIRNVIHGVGKPRIIISPDVVQAVGLVASANSTSVTLSNITGVNPVPNNIYNGSLIEGTDANGDYVYAKILSSNDKVFTVDRWYGGTDLDTAVFGFPATDVNAGVYIRGFVIDLPFANQLTESFTLDTIHHKLFNGSISIKKRGWWYSASLDYQNFMSKLTLQSLENIFNLGETYFRFYPRVDNPKVYYKVYFSQDFVLSFYQGKFHKAHKGISIPLIGTERMKDIDLTTEIEYQMLGYGDYYGDTEYIGNPLTPDYITSELALDGVTPNRLVDNSGNTFTDGNGNRISIRIPIITQAELQEAT